MEQNKREQFIIRRIGGTTYKVRVVFNESGGETLEDKILRIVRNDMVTNDGTYGICLLYTSQKGADSYEISI